MVLTPGNSGKRSKYSEGPIPEDLSPEELTYYREIGGFDPIVEKIPPSNEKGYVLPAGVKYYYYYAQIPLENDPELLAAGVTVSARVNVDLSGVNHNRMIFERGNELANVDCVHTAIYTTPVKKMISSSEETLTTIGSSAEPHFVHLPPWEQFVAMKSFVAGLVSIGLLNLTDLDRDPPAASMAGFDADLVFLIKQALFDIVPEVMVTRTLPEFIAFIDRAPPQDIITNYERLQVQFHLSLFLANPYVIDALDSQLRRRLLDLCLYCVNLKNYLDESLNEDLRETFHLLCSEDFLSSLDVTDLYSIVKAMDAHSLMLGSDPRNSHVSTRIFFQLMSRTDNHLLDF